MTVERLRSLNTGGPSALFRVVCRGPSTCVQSLLNLLRGC